MTKYTFFTRDFFSNSGSYDLSSKHYWTLLQSCLEYCYTFSLVIRKCTNNNIVRELNQWIMPTPNYPFQNESDYEHRVFYSVCKDSIEYLYTISDSLFDFLILPNHFYPEDPVFYRNDCSIFLDSTVHEGECSIFPRDSENVNGILAFGHWLKMAGGDLYSLGQPCAPARDHQIAISPEWRLNADPLYKALLEVREVPTLSYHTQSIELLWMYTKEIQKSILQSSFNTSSHSFQYSPPWFIAFKMYVLGQCGAMTNDEIPKAIIESGYDNNSAVVRFYSLLDEFAKEIQDRAI